MRSRHVFYLLLLGLSGYSLTMLGIEASTSQEHVRHYFTDITGPVPFYAVNTTLSVFLLWGTALLFGACVACASLSNDKAAGRFYLIQTGIFLWLGCDDRFQFHETIARILSIGDHYVLAPVALLQAGLLVMFGRMFLPRVAQLSLVIAAAFFVVMFVVDAWFPHDGFLRLSLEDLAKTWAATFFLLAAWTTLMHRMKLLQMSDDAPALMKPRERTLSHESQSSPVSQGV